MIRKTQSNSTSRKSSSKLSKVYNIRMLEDKENLRPIELSHRLNLTSRRTGSLGEFGRKRSDDQKLEKSDKIEVIDSSPKIVNVLSHQNSYTKHHV